METKLKTEQDVLELINGTIKRINDKTDSLKKAGVYPTDEAVRAFMCIFMKTSLDNVNRGPISEATLKISGKGDGVIELVDTDGDEIELTRDEETQACIDVLNGDTACSTYLLACTLKAVQKFANMRVALYRLLGEISRDVATWETEEPTPAHVAAVSVMMSKSLNDLEFHNDLLTKVVNCYNDKGEIEL